MSVHVLPAAVTVGAAAIALFVVIGWALDRLIGHDAREWAERVGNDDDSGPKASSNGIRRVRGRGR